jgi:Ribbon-helix-helix protein, copG family
VVIFELAVTQLIGLLLISPPFPPKQQKIASRRMHLLAKCPPDTVPNTMNQSTQQITLGTRSMSLKQLNVKIPEQELKILEAFAEKTERTKTDIIREFIRSLQHKV